jgi:outer membrane protein assembly factor BamB
MPVLKGKYMRSEGKHRKVFWGVGALLIVGLLAWWLLRQPELRLFALDVQTGNVQWSAALPGPVHEPPSIVVGSKRVIVNVPGDNQQPGTRRVIAFDAASGQKLWQLEPGLVAANTLDEMQAPAEDIPMITTDSVYIRLHDDNNTLLALNATDGQIRWVQTSVADWTTTKSVPVRAVGKHLVVLFYEEEKYILRLLDAQNGKRIKDIWQSSEGEYVDNLKEPNLLADDKTIFLSTSRDSHTITYALDAQTGALRYKIEDTTGSRRLWLVEDTLYTIDWEQIKAFDALTGVEHWVYRLDSNRFQHSSFFSTLRADANSAYIFCNCLFDTEAEGWLFALDTQNGHERWAKPVTQGSMEFRQAMAVSNTPDIVFVPTSSEEQDGIMALSAADGTERWHLTANAAHYINPANDGEQVFVMSYAKRWRNWLALLNLAKR